MTDTNYYIAQTISGGNYGLNGPFFTCYDI